MTPEPTPWWAGAVGYEVYLRSFADGDGDGVGDLDGLAQRLDYLSWLGVDVVWITPCYPSPQADHGYDVADYLDVADEYGGRVALEAVLEGAHARGMRVLLDLVPNHTSSEHPWFRASRQSRTSPYRDYYIWRDPGPGGGPPNNWLSHFGGPAWTFDETTEQYYCHLFLPEQPDLNWSNPDVAAEFDAILGFWLEQGVDGFRVDVAHALVKHPDLPDLPPAANAGRIRADDPLSAFQQLEHVYDSNRPEVLDVYRRWRSIAEAHDALLLGEVYVLEGGHLAPYVVDQDGLHLAFWFAPLHLSRFDPDTIRQVLVEGTDVSVGAIAWVTSSHDSSRAASRLGGGALGRRRALAIVGLQFALPGMPFLYQGEELGLTDAEVPPARARDPIATRAGAHERSRDPARTPMPWEPGPAGGFTTAPEPWLPLGDRKPEETVAAQREDPSSLLHRYRALIAARHEHPPEGRVEWLTHAGPVVAFRRGDLVVAANLTDERVAWAATPGSGRVLWCSRGTADRFAGALEAGQAVWLSAL